MRENIQISKLRVLKVFKQNLPTTLLKIYVKGNIYILVMLSGFMVYIYKKVIGEKTYYYLRASKRKDNKIITKDIAYLGSSIEDVKRTLEKLPKYSDKIRKAYKTINHFLESNAYLEKIRLLKLKKDRLLEYEKLLEVEACKLHFNITFKKYDELTKGEILKNFIIEFAYNTTSIEGNTIKLDEARSLLENGFTPKNKTLREIYDLQNTEKIFLELFKLEDEMNHSIIEKIHSQLMDNIDNRKGYRTMDVRVIKANFKATPAPYVKTDMGLLLKWYKENRGNLHPLVSAAIFHHKFEKIHPFMDGNGRVGRILLNFILLKNDYPPLIILNKYRKEYLEALRKADKTNLTDISEGYKPLVNFIADEMLNVYWNIFL